MQLPFTVDLQSKVVVVTGGSGVLGSTMCEALAKCGAKVAILATNQEKMDTLVKKIRESGGTAEGFEVDVLNKDSLERAHEQLTSTFGSTDILINAAGGNHTKATTTTEKLKIEDIYDDSNRTFFDLDPESLDWLLRLNYMGTLLPIQVFSKDMAGKKGGSVINVSSMNGFRPLTKIPAYSGAKAAINNLTQWLSVYYSDVGIRVNAIAPGFFLTKQNETLLLTEEGEYTDRAKKIIEHTPLGRFGDAKELLGTLLWLIDSQSSSFVNGVVIPVDGGFSAYSGV
ncbi:SDR family oxidoreductase [Alteribacter keqinensis]|uniref:SDR family NAD(P)-dependent oxidoreductase n=1 Tax=Alteribacter keqinensis TaxID=2483800 RepID=A0A3M7TQD0_9BACI|nr:SDR family oxidoreductase [Alteribacter keqinensis]RNA67217.1 SDR family NAD(P)-dependent oxidoreductase [Alteribacter keqinensis]